MAPPNRKKYESARELFGQCADGEILQELKTEWVPELGYRSFVEAKCSVTDYVVGYYSKTRPHKHNCGLSPNSAEQLYWTDY
jgi:putative transposase